MLFEFSFLVDEGGGEGRGMGWDGMVMGVEDESRSLEANVVIV